MCLAVIACNVHPRYALVVAANRDEYHRRPTEPAHWWKDGTGHVLLAGRDLEHGGTWLGIDRRGRYAFVTNVREAGRHDPKAPSRGSLVLRVVRDAAGVHDAVERAVQDAVRHNGFNLVAGDAGVNVFASNREAGVVTLSEGIHGVSNAGLDTPWPKLTSTKAAVAGWSDAGDRELDQLFDALANRAAASDDALPDTGITRERERLLSSPFIVSPDYGTRSSTIVTIDRAGSVQFVERSFDASGRPTGEVRYAFDRDTPAKRANG